MILTKFTYRLINQSRKQALVFILCVSLSLLTLTSIGGFSNSISYSMLKDAKQLHGADIIVRSHYPISNKLSLAIKIKEQQNKVKSSLIYEFSSMVRNPRTEHSILSSLKVVTKSYPFYGKIKLASDRNFQDVLKKDHIILEQQVLDRLEANIGDTLKIGSAFLKIADVVISEPDRPVSFFSFGPRIFINEKNLESINLIKKGSRINFKYLLKLTDEKLINEFARNLTKVAISGQEHVKTFRQSSSRIKKFIENFLFFLNLIGLFTFLLAGIGIQTSLQALLQENIHTIAIMKSIGASSLFINGHFIGMLTILGTTGTFFGLSLSYILQLYLPLLFAGFMPDNVQLVINLEVVVKGIILGYFVVGLFSFLPLYQLKSLKPAYIFRKELQTRLNNPAIYIGISAMCLFFLCMTIWQLDDIKMGVAFVTGLSLLIGIISITSHGILRFMKKKEPANLAIRQAFRGLFRPNNSTKAIIITLSTSLAVLFSMYLIKENLHATFIKSYPPSLPNVYFLDIQKNQKEIFNTILGIELNYFPVIRARLISINNKAIDFKKEQNRKRDNLAREFNLTYRNSLLGDEQLIKGKMLFGNNNSRLRLRGEIPVSILDTVAEMGKISVGDLLVFNFQGFPIKARVTSMRSRNASKIRPFFYFVFQQQDLINMPQTLFTATKIEPQRLAQIQNILTQHLPHVTIIDIRKTINMVSKTLNKMSSIISFFSIFSIIAGLLIIISSIFATRLTRIREVVYYKVLGANSFFVLQVLFFENLLIGLICSILACCISVIGSWITCYFIFSIPFKPFICSLLLMTGGVLLLVISVGLISSISILKQKPILILNINENN